MIKCVEKDSLMLYCHKCKNAYHAKLAACLSFHGNSCPECPVCKKGTSADNQSFEKFCKFYNRLRNTDETKLSLIANDFITKRGEPFLSVSFTCNICKKQFIFNFDKIKKLSQSPASFRCPKCKQNTPPLSLVKSYFGSLRWVIELFDFSLPWGFLLEIKQLD